MGVDVELWRARIGLFNGGRGGRSRHASLTRQVLHCDVINIVVAMVLLTQYCSLSLFLAEDATSNCDKSVIESLLNTRQDPKNRALPCNCCYEVVVPERKKEFTPHHSSNICFSRTITVILIGVIVIYSLSLLLLLAGDVELNPGPGLNTVLTPSDIFEVYEKVSSASPNWFNLGLALELSYTDLANFRDMYRGDNDVCLREALARRLQSGGLLTWGGICTALRHSKVARNDVAEVIKKYVEGLAPSAVQALFSVNEGEKKAEIVEINLDSAVGDKPQEKCAPERINREELEISQSTQEKDSSDGVIVVYSFSLLLLLAGDVELNPGPGMDTVLSISNLFEVCEKVRSASPNWFYLGLALKLSYTDLTNIEGKCRGDNDVCLREALARRLQSGGPLTWRGICTALRSSTVARNDVAVEIEEYVESTSGLTVNELEADSADMEIQFNHLVSLLLKSLHDRRITKECLVAILVGINTQKKVFGRRNQCVFRAQRRRLDNCSTITDIWPILADYFSFFDYEMVDHITNNLGTGEDQEKMKLYKNEFIKYAKRRVVKGEISLNSREDTDTVIVKLDSAYDNCEMGRLKLFQRNLSSILNLNDGVLKLLKIDDGCIELTFSLPSFTTSDIFPLSTDQEHALQGQGVLQLHCGDVHYPAEVGRNFLSIDNLSTDIRVVETCSLSIDDLHDVFDAVIDTADEWYNFGLALKVLEPTLRQIKANNGSSDCKTCLRETLSHWLQIGQSTTWQDVIRALCSRSVDQSKLAEDIARSKGLTVPATPKPITPRDKSRSGLSPDRTLWVDGNFLSLDDLPKDTPVDDPRQKNDQQLSPRCSTPSSGYITSFSEYPEEGPDSPTTGSMTSLDSLLTHAEQWTIPERMYSPIDAAVHAGPSDFSHMNTQYDIPALEIMSSPIDAALEKMSSPIDAAVHGDTAYFRPYRSRKIYSFNFYSGWSNSADCLVRDASLVVLPVVYKGAVHFHLHTIGGRKRREDQKGPADKFTDAIFQLTPTHDKWKYSISYPKLKTERSHVTAILSDKYLIIAGGSNALGPVNTVDVLALTFTFTSNWREVACLPYKVFRASGCVCNGMLYVLGGYMSPFDPIRSVCVATVSQLVESHSNDQGIFRKIQNLEFTHSACVSFCNHVLAIGGWKLDTETGQQKGTKLVHVYDTNENVWKELKGQLSESRCLSFAATFEDKQKIMIVGGYDRPSGACTDSVEFAIIP